MREIATASKQAGVKNILSVGGWTNSEEGGFEAATTTAEGVEKLAQSIVDYAVEWKFDGVDIDWEYPDTDAEKTQFTNLITSLRSKLDMLGKQNDIYYQLSAAVTVNHNNMAYINPKGHDHVTRLCQRHGLRHPRRFRSCYGPQCCAVCQRSG
jgi:chitinase